MTEEELARDFWAIAHEKNPKLAEEDYSPEEDFEADVAEMEGGSSDLLDLPPEMVERGAESAPSDPPPDPGDWETVHDDTWGRP